jgi:hypothetical protein
MASYAFRLRSVSYGGRGRLQPAYELCDARKNKREGCAYLKPLQTLTAGIPFGRPYSAPFSVR